MKKKIGLFLVLLVVSVSLISCGETSVENNMPSGYEIASSFKVGDDSSVYALKHIETNCYYAFSDRAGYSGGTSITQMFIERDGSSVPYCEGGE